MTAGSRVLAVQAREITNTMRVRIYGSRCNFWAWNLLQKKSEPFLRGMQLGYGVVSQYRMYGEKDECLGRESHNNGTLYSFFFWPFKHWFLYRGRVTSWGVKRLGVRRSRERAIQQGRAFRKEEKKQRVFDKKIFPFFASLIFFQGPGRVSLLRLQQQYPRCLGDSYSHSYIV